ncbi:hypothetical protein BDY24DRAFT_379021 [Mrakia frigida]|uniref:uncharacterized protein n=1 Tax=Mrakia frigida TaxID=29902 RepID=UPI003FCC1C8D
MLASLFKKRHLSIDSNPTPTTSSDGNVRNPFGAENLPSSSSSSSSTAERAPTSSSSFFSSSPSGKSNKQQLSNRSSSNNDFINLQQPASSTPIHSPKRSGFFRRRHSIESLVVVEGEGAGGGGEEGKLKEKENENENMESPSSMRVRASEKKRRFRLVYDGVGSNGKSSSSSSPYRSSTTPAARSSPDVSIARSPSTEEAFYSFRLPEPLPAGTPTTGRKGILREGQAPGTGNSVRFFSRDNIRIISPAPSPDVSHSSQLFADSRTSPLHQEQRHDEEDTSLDEETGIDQSLAIGITSSPTSSTNQDSPPSQFAHRSQIEIPTTPLMASTSSFLARIRDMSPSTPDHTRSTLGGSSSSSSFGRRFVEEEEEEEVTLEMLSTNAERSNRRKSTTPTGSPAVRGSTSLFPPPSTSPLNRNSPLTFGSGYLPMDSPHRLSTIAGSTSPRGSMMLEIADGGDESFTSLPSMDFPVPPEDMSNLMGDVSRQPGMEISDSNVTSMDQDQEEEGDQDESRTTRGGQDATTRMSSSFPYLSMESSTRSSCDEERSSSNNPFRSSHSFESNGASLHQASSMSKDRRRESATSTLSVISSQNTITEAIDYYSQPTDAQTPPRPSPSTPAAANADLTIYHTPSPPPPTSSSSSRNRSSFLPSSSSADRTVYHTPRSANSSLHFGSISFNTPRTLASTTTPSRSGGGGGDVSTFLANNNNNSSNPDASFARSIVEKGITPGQVGSPSFYFNLDQSPSVPPSHRNEGEMILVPSLSPNEVLALNTEFYESQQQLIESSRTKYALQLEISQELEASLAKREAELKALRKEVVTGGGQRAEVEVGGEVRDLEVRLEAERRETEKVREERDEEREKRKELESGLEELKEGFERLEAENRDREIRGVRERRNVEEEGEGEEKERVVLQLREKISQRELSLWEVRAKLLEQEKVLEMAREDNGTLAGQVDSLEDQVASLTETNGSLVETVSEQDKLIESLSIRLRTQESERVEQASKVEKAHHLELENVRASSSLVVVADKSSRSLLATSPISSPSSSLDLQSGLLPVVVAALRRDLSSLTSQSLRDQAKIQINSEELENQWKRADETYDEITKLKHHRDQLQETCTRLEEDYAALDQQLVQVSAEKESLLDTQDALIGQRDAVMAEKEELEAQGGGGSGQQEELEEERDFLLEERDRIVAQRDEAWEERDELQVKLEEAMGTIEAMEGEAAEMNEQITQLSEEITTLTSQRTIDIDQLVRLRATNLELVAVQDEQTSKDRTHQEHLDSLSAEISAKDSTLRDLKAQLHSLDESHSKSLRQQTLALEQAQEDAEKRVRDLNRTIKEQTRRITTLEKTREEERQQFEEAIAERASAEMEAHLSGSRLDADSGELEKLSKLIAHLRSEDAKKEVTILRLTRTKMELKSDLESSEIALESKQQELELVKRKFGVRGVAGSTPAPNRALHSSHTAAPSTVSRRQSVASTPFTPGPAPALPPSSYSATPSAAVPDTPGPARSARPRSSLAMGTPLQKPAPPRSRSSLGVSSSSSTQIPQSLPPSTTSRPSMDAPISGRPRFSLAPAPPVSSNGSKISDESPTILTRSMKSVAAIASASSLRRSSSVATPLATSTSSSSVNSNPIAVQATPRRTSIAPPSSRRTSMTPARGMMAPPASAPGPTSSRSMKPSRVMVRKEKSQQEGAERIEEGDKENEVDARRVPMLA